MPNTQGRAKDQVQSIRDKARDILRLKAINRFMEKIYRHNMALETLPSQVEAPTKDVQRAEYKLSKLDPEDPDFETKKERAEQNVEAAQTALQETQERVAEETKQHQEAITELEEKIVKVESGETKISIDKSDELTREMIDQLAFSN